MSDQRAMIDREIAAQFRDGPSRAPLGLLEATLTSTGRMRQRSAMTAALLGAPSAGRRVDVVAAGLTRRDLLVLGLLAGILAGGILVAGAMQLLDRQIVDLRSPRATAAPLASDLTTPPRTPAPVVENVGLGFAVMRNDADPFAEYEDRWNGHDTQGPEGAVDFEFGTCPSSCGGQVSVSSSTPWSGVIVDWMTECGTLSPFDCADLKARGGVPLRLRGASVDELAAAWIGRFGPSESDRQTVEGIDEVILWNANSTGALFVRGGRTFSVMVHATDGSPQPNQLARLRQFLASLRFPKPEAAIYRNDDLGLVVSSEDAGPWHDVHQGWGAGPGDETSVVFFFGQCADNLCNAPYVSLSYGDPATGAIVQRTETGDFLRVRGSTLEKLRASWAALYPDHEFKDATVDGRPAILALGDHTNLAVLTALNGRTVSVSIQPGAFASFEKAKLEGRLTAFVGAIYLPVNVPSTSPTPEPSPAGTLGDLTVTMPAGWIVRPSETRMSVEVAGGGVLGPGMFVAALEPGAGLDVPHPSTSYANGRFRVAGRTFREVVAAVDVALPDATRRDVEIGGQPAIRWLVPQRSYIGPLVNVAVVEWKKSFYVFVQLLPFDGSPGTRFDRLLAGVTLN